MLSVHDSAILTKPNLTNNIYNQIMLVVPPQIHRKNITLLQNRKKRYPQRNTTHISLLFPELSSCKPFKSINPA